MIVPGDANPLLFNAPAGGYTIAKSLRFRSSASAGFIKTTGYPTPTNTSKWTVSMWVKRGAIGFNYAGLFGHTISAAANFSMYFASDDKLYWNFNNTYGNVTTQVFRDPSAWYHFVFVWDSANATASNRARIYVNGAEITSYSTDTRANITTSMDCWNTTNTTYASGIGANSATASTITNFFDGYFAEVYNIDGQTLTPSDFGKTDPATGVWVPIQYTGTYGGAGFYFKFTDIAATSGSNVGYGKDFSPNGNYWNTQNFSTTAGVTYDSMVDTPTNYDNGGNGAGNYATLNPVFPSGGTYSNANLKFVGPTAWANARSTIELPSSGKWYFEATVIANGQNNTLGSSYSYVGVTATSTTPSALGYNGANFVTLTDTGWLNNNATTSNAVGAALAANNLIGIAIDVDNNTFTFYRTNSSVASGTIGMSAGTPLVFVNGSYSAAYGNFDVNFGQRPFTYTLPTGFKALCTQNLPTPTIGATSSTLANKYFDASLYTGTGSALSVTNSGAFQPDLVWIKIRSAASSHCLYDTARGVRAGLFSNLTNAETTEAAGVSLTAFNSNGFALGTDNAVTGSTNLNGGTYVGWQWKANGSGSSNTSGTITSTVSANVTAGFSVVTWTGTGANATVGHGLSVAPKFILLKSRTYASGNWLAWHTALAQPYALWFNLSGAQVSYPTAFNSTNPTSSVFSVGTATETNGSTYTFVAYCFAEVAGYSKFGSYTGNGSADGTFVYCGFRPKWILIKRTDTTGDWMMYDAARDGQSANGADYKLYANLSSAENGGDTTTTNLVDYLSNGFKLRSTNTYTNGSSVPYIFAAFAEFPFNYARAR